MADEKTPAPSEPDTTPPVAEAEARAEEVGDGKKLDESHPVPVGTEPGEAEALPAGQRPPTADSVRIEIQQLEEDLAQQQGGYDAYEAATKGSAGDLSRSQNRDAHEAYGRIQARIEHLRSALGSA